MTDSKDEMLIQIKLIQGWTRWILKVMDKMVYNNRTNIGISIKEQRKLQGNVSRRRP